MKTLVLNLSLALFVLLFWGCRNSGPEDDRIEYRVAYPLTVSLSEFESDVSMEAPQPVEEPGKIYAYENWILISEQGKGIHVLDNSDPEAPLKIGFIPIIGNRDLSIKDDILYADSLRDLLVFDFSDPGSISMISRLKDVLQDPVVWPAEAELFEYGQIGNDEILVGWEVRTELRSPPDIQVDILWAEDAALSNSTGQGGSLARFRIVGEYLYAVDSHSIHIFDITDLLNPQVQESVFAGFDIERLDNQGEMLGVGRRAGVYMYDIAEPSSPVYVSEFQHGTACDPVVVEGDYAYVTLRGGTVCGAAESGLYIIDIQNLYQPKQLAFYPLDGPYGLGYHGSHLYVCDGDSGLKVYDKSDLESLELIQHFDYEEAFDLIPLDSHLILIAGQRLLQFDYASGGLELIGEHSLLD
jgi:hypothetical protein